MDEPCIAVQEALWDILDMEAKLSYFLWKKDENKWAEKPAIIVCTGFGLAPDHKSGEWCTVYFGHGIAYWNVKNLKQAKLKAEAFLSQYSGKIKRVDDRGRTFRIDLRKS
jgi:hypothetical protein